MQGNPANVTITHSLWADSVAVINGDSVFYLNQVIKPNVYVQNLGIPYDQPQFLQMKMIEQMNGIYAFQDSELFYLNTLANVGDSWAFHPALNLTATVVSAQIATIFNQVDSVKIITLSNNDTIKIAKLHGIIQFPDYKSTQPNYKLVGIENPNEGEQVLGFWDIYDYQVGDIFEFDLSIGSVDYQTDYREQWHILARDTINDTLVYQVNRFAHELFYGIWNWTPVLFWDDVWQDTVKIKYHADSCIANAYPFQYDMFKLYSLEDGYNNPGLYVFYEKLETAIQKEGYDTTMQCVYKSTLGKAFKKQSAIYPYTAEDGNVFYLDYKLGKGIGAYEYSFGFFESGYGKHMLGYVKNGDTVGVISPDWVFTSNQPITNTLNLIAYPNPVKDMLILQMPNYSNEPLSIELYNVLGEKIELNEITVLDNEVHLNLSFLAQGMYVLWIKQGNQAKSIKVMKE